MIQRIIATIVISILYVFFSVQGLSGPAHQDFAYAKSGVAAEERRISSGDLSSRRMPVELGAVPSEPVRPESAVAQYDEQENVWQFSAKVVEVKEVSIYGRRGTIARIEYQRDGQTEYAWVALSIDEFYFSGGPELIAPGREIILELAGDQVSAAGVNWDGCLTSDLFCQYARFIEGGFPKSDDFGGLALCPTNLLIYTGQVSDDWINGMLAWRIRVGST